MQRVTTSRPALVLAALMSASLMAGATSGTEAVAATRPVARTAPAAHTVLPWIADDYTRAVAEAKARKVPLFIEAWAPW